MSALEVLDSEPEVAGIMGPASGLHVVAGALVGVPTAPEVPCDSPCPAHVLFACMRGDPARRSRVNHDGVVEVRPLDQQRSQVRVGEPVRLLTSEGVSR